MQPWEWIIAKNALRHAVSVPLLAKQWQTNLNNHLNKKTAQRAVFLCDRPGNRTPPPHKLPVLLRCIRYQIDMLESVGGNGLSANEEG